MLGYPKLDGPFDYVIVGGGTAGSVLAARLSEDPKVRVLLLEAGPKPNSLWIKMPAGMGKLFVNSRFNWGYITEPEQRLGGRALYWPQGMTLGGSSAINGMAYVRGHAEDYDDWEAQGAPGWGWGSVLPYFKKLERWSGSSVWRGDAGPLAINWAGYVHSSSDAFRTACCAAGLVTNPDYNGSSQEGVGGLQFTIANGTRQSAAMAYLRPASNRRNLVIATHCRAEKLIIQDGRAAGVKYRRKGVLHEVRADGEVIVASGAIGSPRLLLLSGIGPAEQLTSLGINAVADLPGVGANLADHPYVHMTFQTRARDSLNPQLRGWRVWMHGVRWLFTHSGPLTIGASQAVAFVRGLPDAGRPDLQINFRPISHSFDAAGRLGPDEIPRITAAICALRPGSAGTVRLRSADPDVAPSIAANYLADPKDEDALVAGVKWSRRIFARAPLNGIVISEDKPGPGFADDDAIRAFIRDTTQTSCHPVGTCRMGQDTLAVVDERLRVRGVRGLRVVDASIMPSIVSGNTAAVCFMIGEKGADLIKADAMSNDGTQYRRA